MKLRIIGYTDQINECDCCGKKELKGTYVMADEMDNEMYFGKVCGAKHANWSMSEFSENLTAFKTKMKRNEKVAQLVETLKIEIEKIGWYSKYAKYHDGSFAQNDFFAERAILENKEKLNIDLLNEVFIPLNYPECDKSCNQMIYRIKGKCFYYER